MDKGPSEKDVMAHCELEQNAKDITRRIAELKKIRRVIRRVNKDPMVRKKINVEQVTVYTECLETSTGFLNHYLGI